MEKDKCPVCGCEEITYQSWSESIGVVEYIIKCKQCENIKEYWAYGGLCVQDWEDLGDKE